MTISRHANLVSFRLSGGLGSAGMNRDAQAVIPWPWRRDPYGLVGGSSMRVSHPPSYLVALGVGRSRPNASSLDGLPTNPIRQDRHTLTHRCLTSTKTRADLRPPKSLPTLKLYNSRGVAASTEWTSRAKRVVSGATGGDRPREPAAWIATRPAGLHRRASCRRGRAASTTRSCGPRRSAGCPAPRSACPDPRPWPR